MEEVLRIKRTGIPTGVGLSPPLDFFAGFPCTFLSGYKRDETGSYGRHTDRTVHYEDTIPSNIHLQALYMFYAYRPPSCSRVPSEVDCSST